MCWLSLAAGFIYEAGVSGREALVCALQACRPSLLRPVQALRGSPHPRFSMFWLRPGSNGFVSVLTVMTTSLLAMEVERVIFRKWGGVEATP